jgi:hypothetical protein
MQSPPPNNVRGKLHEVALRYRRYRRSHRDNANLMGRKRLRDLGRFFHHRYGGLTLPDDDSGRADLAVALDHIVRRSDGALFLRKWVGSWAAWISDLELEKMVSTAGLTWTATALGTHLRLTDDERTKLKITTIAPRDLTDAEWEKIRKSRKRQRDRDSKRRERGKATAARKMPKPKELRMDVVRSLLPPGWISTDQLMDDVTIFPGLCDLQPKSRRRVLNRTINDLKKANEIEIKIGQRGSRSIREISASDD